LIKKKNKEEERSDPTKIASLYFTLKPQEKRIGLAQSKNPWYNDFNIL
jgi:hypothetical protein